MKKSFSLLLAAATVLAGCDPKSPTPEPGKTEYTISVTPVTGGDIAVTVAGKPATKAVAGAEVILAATASEEYEFTRWSITGIEPADPTENPLTFTMPAGNVAVTAEFREKQSAETYDVIVTQSDGGSVAATTTGGKPATDITNGTEVTLTATPNEDYEFVEWSITGIEPADLTENPLTFAMPEGDVTVEAVFGDGGVEINDVVWAECNVGFPKAFAETPQTLGLHYQWNGSMGWESTTGNPPTLTAYAAGGTSVPMQWPSSGVAAESDTVWSETYDPCPEGWRVPSTAELAALCDTQYVTIVWSSRTETAPAGLTFTDKATEKSIFLPAGGWLMMSNGRWQYANQYGDYWSSERWTTASSPNSYKLSFDNSGARPDGFASPAYGCLIRCVKK